MSAETRIAEAQMAATAKAEQQEAQRLANEKATNDVAELFMESEEVTEDQILSVIDAYKIENPSVEITIESVKDILKTFEVNVVAAQVSAEVAEVVENPLTQAASRILSVLRDNIEADMSPEDWINNSSPQIISILTENRRGKSALSALKVWEEIIKVNTAFALREDLKELFIKKFSNLRTN